MENKCRCCGEDFKRGPQHPNPNICLACEQLLEDFSPEGAANIFSFEQDMEDALHNFVPPPPLSSPEEVRDDSISKKPE